MSNPITEFAFATGIAIAICASAVAVLPQEPPAAAARVPINPPPVATARAEPAHRLTNAERVDALQRRIAAIAAEQKAMADALKSLARERTIR